MICTETYDKIDAELSDIKKTRKDMCRETGISYNTLSSLYQRKSENISLEVLRIIARYLNVSLDYLIFDDIKDKNFGKQNSPASTSEAGELESDERDLVADYRLLNENGKEAARNAVHGFTTIPVYKKSYESKFLEENA